MRALYGLLLTTRWLVVDLSYTTFFPYKETIMKTSSSFSYNMTIFFLQYDNHKDITFSPYNVTIIKTKLGYAFFHIQPTGRQPALPCYKEEGVHGGE